MLDLSGNLDDAVPFRDEKLNFDELMHLASQQVPTDVDAKNRWQRLLDAMTTVASGSSVAENLARIVRTGTDLTGAHYGTVRLIDGDEVTTQPRDGPPSGPLPLRAFLEVPVRVGDRVLGALYLTGSIDKAEFTEQDEEIAAALGDAAGVVVENARLHQENDRLHHEIARRDRWLSYATVRSEPDTTALQVVADWARELSGADVAWLVAGSDPAHLRLRVVSGFDADPDAMAAVDFSTSLSRCVAFSGHALTVKSLSKHSRAVDVSAALGAGATGPGVVVALHSSGGVEAAITLAWRGDDADAARTDHDPSLATLIAEQAPLLLRAAVARQNEQRLALLEDRDRVARDLHDVVIQQLFAIGLDLHSISWLQDPEEITRRLDRTTDEIDVAIDELRRTIFRLGTRDRTADPRAAVSEVVERAARTMKVRPVLRFRGPVGSLLSAEVLPDVLAVLTEGLSNAVRHARASKCVVEVGVVDEITVRVSDDGTGMPDTVAESGLANVRFRAEKRGGHFRVTSSSSGGTSLLWSVPLN